MKKALAICVLGLLAPCLRADDSAKKPDDPEKRVKAALEAILKATDDLPLSEDAAQIKKWAKKLQQQITDAEKRLILAQSEMEQARDRSAWSERMVTKKYLSPSQAEADKVKLLAAEHKLELAKRDLDQLFGKKKPEKR